MDNVDRKFRGKSRDQQGSDPYEAIPSVDHGSILVTSRLSDLRVSGKELQLGHVSNDEAKAILESRAGRSLQGRSLLIA